MESGSLPMLSSAEHERLHVRDLARHQELQRVLRAGIVGEVDQPLVDDLGPRFGGDVAAQVHVEFAGDFEVVGRPGIALRVEQIDAAAAGRWRSADRPRRRRDPLRRFQVHPGQRADDFKMAQLLGADVHEQVFAAGSSQLSP